MPLGLIKSLAKTHGLSESTVERYWSECKASVKPGKGKGYGAVVECVKNRCRAKAAKK